MIALQENNKKETWTINHKQTTEEEKQRVSSSIWEILSNRTDIMKIYVEKDDNEEENEEEYEYNAYLEEASVEEILAEETTDLVSDKWTETDEVFDEEIKEAIYEN